MENQVQNTKIIRIKESDVQDDASDASVYKQLKVDILKNQPTTVIWDNVTLGFCAVWGNGNSGNDYWATNNGGLSAGLIHIVENASGSITSVYVPLNCITNGSSTQFATLVRFTWTDSTGKQYYQVAPTAA